jgi:hypothetical protein
VFLFSAWVPVSVVCRREEISEEMGLEERERETEIWVQGSSWIRVGGCGIAD